MRRFLLLALVVLMSLVVGPGLPAAQAGDGPVVELRRVWVVAGGAAAEARFRVTCQPGDSPVWLALGMHQDGVDHVASGTISSFTCTGSPQRFVLPLQNATGTNLVPVETGTAEVAHNLFNCVEGRDPCYELTGETSATVVQDGFVRPYDEDLNAELTLVNSRLLPDGRVRVAYDLVCDGVQTAPGPVGTTITQVTPSGALRYGTGGKPSNATDVECDSEVQRFRYIVTPTTGRFREGRSFVDTTFGSRFDWGVYATDQHPLRLAH